MVYFISDLENIKIGYTKNSPKKRLNQLNTGSPKQLYLLGYIEGGKEKERELQIMFNKFRLRINGEWFYPADEIINYINDNNLIQNNYILFENNKINIVFIIRG